MIRKTIAIICFLMCFLSVYGQIVVNMEQDGGLYKVPCTVNGVKMKFIFDTGASAVSLSKSMATFMEDNGYLHKSDYLGKTQTQIADGSVVDVEVVSLKDFEIGGLHLKDVIATVKDGQNVPLLMGQSVIEKLGRISIDGNRLIVHGYTVQLSEREIETLRRGIQNDYRSRNLELVIDKVEKLKLATTLSDEDYYYYLLALTESTEFDKAVAAYNDWKVQGTHDNRFLNERIFTCAGDAYSLRKNPNEALKCYQEALGYADMRAQAYVYMKMADCYYDLNRKIDMDNCLDKGLSTQYTILNVSIADVLANDVQDDILGGLYFRNALYEDHFTGDYTQSVFYMKLSAKCGFESAIRYCTNAQIDYRK